MNRLNRETGVEVRKETKKAKFTIRALNLLYKPELNW